MDSILSLFFWTGLTGFTGLFLFFSQFPDETEKSQSDFVVIF